MPLMSTGIKEMLNNNRRAIGFWMTVGGRRPIEVIRVFVTYQALAQLDPSQPEDIFAAIAIFGKNRTQIEAAASYKYDTEGLDDNGEHEGKPILTVHSEDLAELVYPP